MENTGKTVTELLTEIEDEICNDYCKFPDIAREEVKDANAAEDLLYTKYCKGCPLNKL